MRGFPVSTSGFSRRFWHAFHSGFRRHVRSLSRAQGLRRSWGRLSSVVCRPVRPWLFDWPWLRPEAAQETPNRIFAPADLCRLADLQPGGASTPGRPMRRGPYHGWDRLSISLDHHACGSRPRHTRAERRRQTGHLGRECSQAVASPRLAWRVAPIPQDCAGESYRVDCSATGS